MPIMDIYSRRKKRAEQTEADVYQYDTMPDALRVQVMHIWDSALGGARSNEKDWTFIRDTLCREKGLQQLGRGMNAKEECCQYIVREGRIDDLLDIVELSFRVIELVMGDRPEWVRREREVTQDPEDAIDELNFRFREAGVGYQYEGNIIVKVDSQLVHAEVVRPALQLLSDPRFKGPQEEFLAAHAHYRAGEHKDAVADALNAFESTMKTICDIKGWQYQKGARATDLIKVIRANKLLPDYLDGSFDQLIATLSSGLPKVRNEAGGHGQGAEPKETPSYVAAYALHLCASKIVLLVETMKDSK